MKANVRSVDGLLQLCYNLPHRVHTAKVYPLSSSNGSTIIIYGHVQGLRLLWRGGHQFTKDQELAERDPNSNGASKDVIMTMDSTDGQVGNDTASENGPIFQDEEAEFDPSAPYNAIIQSLDLLLGVEVLHLSFPYLPSDLDTSSVPQLVSEKILVAVNCSDCTVRLLSIPLTPPSPRQKAKAQQRDRVTILGAEDSLFGEQMVVLSSEMMHQSIPQGVSISMTAYTPVDLEDSDMKDTDRETTRRPSSQHTSRSRNGSQLGRDQEWELLVASHSTDLSGLLFIYKIPLENGGARISTDVESHFPWRSQHLASPAVSVEFSSALYPASRHSQLLVAEATGAIRIFDCVPYSKGGKGAWLVSLYTEFEACHNSIPRRKPILDARWVLGGKGILVLQADGKWGIWNHEGRGPRPAETSFSAQNQPVGSLTDFALSGWVGTSLKSKPIPKSSKNRSESRSKLAPMTPSTRKIKQDALFSGPSTVSDGPARGGLSITAIRDTSSSKPDDESILLWHGTTAMVIPSLLTHWQNKIRGSGNLFGSGATGEPRTINNIQLGGQLCNEVDLLPNYQHPRLAEHRSIKQAILVTGEKRLLIITPPLTAPESATSTALELSSSTADQQLLDQGELDVNGMDRVLAGMSNGNHTSRRNSQISNARSLLSK